MKKTELKGIPGVIHAYRQGNQWIVYKWSDRYRAWLESKPVGYWTAIKAIHDVRETRKRGEYVTP